MPVIFEVKPGYVAAISIIGLEVTISICEINRYPHEGTQEDLVNEKQGVKGRERKGEDEVLGDVRHCEQVLGGEQSTISRSMMTLENIFNG